jgi:hypothetical protein
MLIEKYNKIKKIKNWKENIENIKLFFAKRNKINKSLQNLYFIANIQWYFLGYVTPGWCFFPIPH